jgi:hypothetical protein
MTVSVHTPQTALTVSTTELSLISGTSTLQNNNTAAMYQVSIDASAMAKGDRFRVKIYKAVRSGGTKRLFLQADIYNAQSELFVMAPVMLLFSWDVTIQKIAGTDRAFDTSIDRAG